MEKVLYSALDAPLAIPMCPFLSIVYASIVQFQILDIAFTYYIKYVPVAITKNQYLAVEDNMEKVCSKFKMAPENNKIGYLH